MSKPKYKYSCPFCGNNIYFERELTTIIVCPICNKDKLEKIENEGYDNVECPICHKFVVKRGLALHIKMAHKKE